MSVLRKLIATKNISNKLVALTSAFKKTYSNNIQHSDLPDETIPNCSVDQFLFTKTEKWHNHLATECAVSSRKFTYEEIQTKSVNLGRNLRKKLNLKKGDVIAILLPNSPEYILAVLGALQAGLIVTTLNPLYTPEEISRQLKDCSAKIIITICTLHPVVRAALNVIPDKIHILATKSQQDEGLPQGTLNLAEFLEPIDYPDLPPASNEDIAFLPYSSGTTGMPKGVELTHRNVIANLVQFNDDEVTVTEETTSQHQDVVPAVLPKFHIYGLMANTLHLFQKGCLTVSLPKFTPELYIQTLRKYKAHVLFLAPPLVLFLSNHPAVTAKDLESVRVMISGAAPLGLSDEERFLQKAQKNISIVQGFGLTETSPLVLMTRPDLKSLAYGGSVGRPVSLTSVKVVDPNDPTAAALGPNQTGELLIKGPQVMKGYHRKVKETQEVFTEDGWLRTGDLMYYNDDKLFFVKDRLKELIKVKAFQVPPAELEEVIRDFPDVADVGVIGIPHPTLGEVPKAFIVPKPNKTIDQFKLQEFVASKVAHYKRLKGGVQIVGSIPKNASGKILRRVLREQHL